jgi:hypothetical protein
MQEAFQGHIDQFIPPGQITGWAMIARSPETDKVDVTVRLGDQIIGRGRADRHRGDLEQFGSGNYAFEILCDQPVPYHSVLSGALKVELSVHGESVGSLQFNQITKNIASVLEIGRLINQLYNYDSMTLRGMLAHAAPHLPEPALSAVQSAITLLKNRDRLEEFTKYEPGSISNVAFKTGIISSDRAAMLGQDGHLFLVEGSNNVSELFSRPYGSAGAESVADNWTRLIKERARFLESLGCEFIQIIVPEKLSVMRELFDGRMSSPSATLAALELALAKAVPEANYISGLAALSRLPFGTSYRKTDSHLTPAGAFSIFREICAKLKAAIFEPVPFDVPILTDGDLGRRFFGYELYEVCYAAKEPTFKAGSELVASHFSPNGGHLGTRQIFRNEQAPIRKKLILFGNSISGSNIFQGQISYWLATWFREYHFIFEPGLDADYVMTEKPDVVICQTIERFLETVPAR